MEEQKNKPSCDGLYDKTKIYTPHSVTQTAVFNGVCDNAPVRIYEKPLKNNNDTAKQYNLF